MSDNEPDCGGCRACAIHHVPEGIDVITAVSYMSRMFVCVTCGNKRCPHATDHRLACTGSNEPNQPGSDYQQRYL